MAISHVIYSQRHSSRLLLLLVLYHLCITGAQQDVIHIPLGGILKLLPDNNSVTENTTGLLWKHDGNKVAEWDTAFGPEVDYYGTYRDRTALNKDTGRLVIYNMNITDGGIYSVEINGRVQSSHNIKVIRRLVKTVGEDVVLPCEVGHYIDLTALTVEWSRPDLPGDPHVHYHRNGGEDDEAKDPSYMRRTFLFQDEVKKGNVSLKLTRVKPSDTGIYSCFIESKKESTVQLVVESSPVEPRLESPPVEPRLESPPAEARLESPPVEPFIIITIIIAIIAIIIAIIAIINGVLHCEKRSIGFHALRKAPPPPLSRPNLNEKILNSEV